LERLEKTRTSSDPIAVDNMQVAYSQEDLIKQLDEAEAQDEV